MALPWPDHEDLWEIFGLFVRAKGWKAVRFTKVKAHAEEQVLNSEMEPLLFLRNALADAGADACAENLVQHLACVEAEKWLGIAFSIARRLAIIEAEA